jgi:probable phosphoglycerate mutase
VRITLVRHAQPEWVREGLSVDNPPLTALGRAQAERLAIRLADERFDELHVSPLVRARETAAPLLARQRREESIQPWLEEIRNPIWHGTPAEKAAAAYREERSRPAADRWDGLHGGEPVRDFVARIRAGAERFLAERGIVRLEHDLPVWRVEDPGRAIACVAHAGTNSVVINLLLGLDPTPWEWERFVLGHASITRLEAMRMGDGYGFSLWPLSDVEHLAADDRTY